MENSILCVPAEETAARDDRTDSERMELEEGDFQEPLSGWTEVEANAPKDVQPKVYIHTCIAGHRGQQGVFPPPKFTES